MHEECCTHDLETLEHGQSPGSDNSKKALALKLGCAISETPKENGNLIFQR